MISRATTLFLILMGCTVKVEPIPPAECQPSSNECTDPLLCEVQTTSGGACDERRTPVTDTIDAIVIDSALDMTPGQRDMGPDVNPSCDDGIVNQGESDEDCGGPCIPCDSGARCLEDLDCESGVCLSNVCTAAACDDGFQNGEESDVDCGGNCSPCADDANCQGNQDCLSGVCSLNTCASPTCADRVQNQNETGVDCGGVCPVCVTCDEQTPCAADEYCNANQCSPKLGDGQQCTENIECVSAYCNSGYCCTSGMCCDRDLDCAGTFDQPAECVSPSECNGVRRESICAGHVCAEALIEDDSACTADSTARECGPYPALACNGGVNQPAPVCATNCSDAIPCDSGFRCEAGSCIQNLNLPNGTPCSQSGDCQSANCQNGICCTGGECCQTPADCTAYPGTPLRCTNPSLCEGTGTNIVCEDFQCGVVEISDDSVCDNNTVAHLCGLYESVTCNGDTAQSPPQCLTECESSEQCDQGARCKDARCEIITLQDAGQACQDSMDCRSGHCQNGFCCDAGDCCSNVTDCPNAYSTAAVCTNPSSCDGEVGLAVCTTDNVCQTVQTPDDRVCNGQEATSCGYYPPVFCGNSVSQPAPTCASSCTSDSDCVANAHCDGSTCQPDLENGANCDENSDCQSGYCGNGFCCGQGDCCAAPRDCPDSYQRAAECIDAATCQGNRLEAVCQANQCASVSVPDDSGCTSGTVAQICLAYLNAQCNGQREQGTPRCPTTCNTDDDCKPAFQCDRSECVPFEEPCIDGMICDPR